MCSTWPIYLMRILKRFYPYENRYFITRNHHTFKSLKKYPRCAHRKYTYAEARKKKWIKKDSQAFKALEKVINNEKTLYLIYLNWQVQIIPVMLRFVILFCCCMDQSILSLILNVWMHVLHWLPLISTRISIGNNLSSKSQIKLVKN